jgi:hypothetical protein
MATTPASYRNPQPTLTLEVLCEQNPPTKARVSLRAIPDPGALLKLSEDLAALCAEGLLEAYRDEHNTVRYRPVERA